MKNKHAAREVNVCKCTVRCWLKEIGFTPKEVKHKPSLTPKQKETRLLWDKEEQN